ncbi:MAG: restriction endonuclease subunit S [Syntrophales bacterium]|nr:restriction endonuclease subunit S [Syntrophales bacterium]
MSEWKEYRFSKFVEISPSVTLEPGAICSFVEMADLKDGNKFCEPSTVRPFNSSGTRFQERDTLFARITPCLENGKICQVRSLLDSKGFGSTEFHVFRGREGLSDIDFVYYLSRWSDVRDFAEANLHGTSGRQRVPRESFDSLFLNLPDYNEQRAIAGVLSSLDDKIDLLHRQNKTLEGMAEALWRQMFMEEANPGWIRKPLGSFFPIKTGKKDANYSAEDGQYPFFTCSQNTLNSPDYSFDGHAILLAGNGDFNLKRYNGKFEAYQRTYVLIPHNELEVGFLYYGMRHHLDDITMGYRGSVINFITKGMIENFQLPIMPDTSIFHEACRRFNEINGKIDSNDGQIRTLSRLRDMLLPKLMSGEVTVKL